MTRPDFAISQKARTRSSKRLIGLPATEAVIRHGLDLIGQYINDYCYQIDFDEMLELIEKGNVENIDLRIKDITKEEKATLPLDLTLANFGKLNKDSKPEDIAAGLINMIFEIIGVMASFNVANKTNKEVVLVGNITALPGVRTVLDRFERFGDIRFFVPDDSEFSVAYGAVIAS